MIGLPRILHCQRTGCRERKSLPKKQQISLFREYVGLFVLMIFERIFHMMLRNQDTLIKNGLQSLSVRKINSKNRPRTLILSSFFVVPNSNLHTTKKVNLANPKMALLYDLPQKNELNWWRKIKFLSAPLGIKDIYFNEEDSKESYLAKNFQEV